MSVPLKVIDRDSALEARIEAEYNAMCKAYTDGDNKKARDHYVEMVKLCGMRSDEFIKQMERLMGLK